MAPIRGAATQNALHDLLAVVRFYDTQCRERVHKALASCRAFPCFTHGGVCKSPGAHGGPLALEVFLKVVRAALTLPVSLGYGLPPPEMSSATTCSR
jgi:hypothetical protein